MSRAPSSVPSSAWRALRVALVCAAVALAAFIASRASAQTPMPTAIGSFEACEVVDRFVPYAVIGSAGANPSSVRGYGELCNPNVPPSPVNVRRYSLDLSNPGIPYHPTFNTLVWRCGCR